MPTCEDHQARTIRNPETTTCSWQTMGTYRNGLRHGPPRIEWRECCLGGDRPTHETPALYPVQRHSQCGRPSRNVYSAHMVPPRTPSLHHLRQRTPVCLGILDASVQTAWCRTEALNGISPTNRRTNGKSE